jgi:hypothetical protein
MFHCSSLKIKITKQQSWRRRWHCLVANPLASATWPEKRPKAAQAAQRSTEVILDHQPQALNGVGFVLCAPFGDLGVAPLIARVTLLPSRSAFQQRRKRPTAPAQNLLRVVAALPPQEIAELVFAGVGFETWLDCSRLIVKAELVDQPDLAVAETPATDLDLPLIGIADRTLRHFRVGTGQGPTIRTTRFPTATDFGRAVHAIPPSAAPCGH